MSTIEAPTLRRTARVITATSLFDGHDVSINIMRRVLQDAGAEVIHLGHNRSVSEIVTAAIQEDADAIAISSYQGGHIEYFKYIVDLLREKGSPDILVYGGGGGVIVPDEIRLIESYGVRKIFSPEDGRRLGLAGMGQQIMRDAAQRKRNAVSPDEMEAFSVTNHRLIARCISEAEEARERGNGALDDLGWRINLRENEHVPVLGVTGTGGAGKSSVVDELITRFLNDFTGKKVAVLSVDPTRRRSGGALLGDRIRMNALNSERVYMRSMATRGRHGEISDALGDAAAIVKAAGFDLVILETAGIGQGDAAIVPLVDCSLYIMTAEFGAPSQLEKIDMLDFADVVAINKFDHRGSEDALRYVRKQLQRNRGAFDAKPEELPVFGTIASRFNDDGVTALYHGIIDAVNKKVDAGWTSHVPRPGSRVSTARSIVVPAENQRYLAEISKTVRMYRQRVEEQAEIAEKLAHYDAVIAESGEGEEITALTRRRNELNDQLAAHERKLLHDFPSMVERYKAEEFVFSVRGKEIRTPLVRTSLSGTRVPRVAIPNYRGAGDRLRWLMLENVPGLFPFTAGVFPFRRTDEDPARMFAGEGDAKRTNERFHYLSKDAAAKRLSTAFDSVTLYGCDPAEAPDIYGKVGTSGVSICTLEDMRTLYGGFDLCAPNTSVSMTINGPAPIILAMFFNAAIDQQVALFEKQNGRNPDSDEFIRIKEHALQSVRGTVQADILKEDQGQNTCIFAIDFAIKMMGDIQQYFIENNIRNFYSVSISGYHIAEAGANPISQVAFTLSNAFTYVEYYLSRGMHVDDFAPNLSFFFSNGMDPEYSVINRVARRIWSVAMRDRYGANERSQKLKAHIQTSGRSLHAQEVQFNDIRTTLQALTALYDNCNSLHTNSFDEAITTPTEDSVRRAMAIQLIINKEYGIYSNENVLQGSHIIEELTDLVEEAVLQEFERISERGGVLGAMETGYQRAKIQEESMYYESRKMSGEYPIIGVNTFTHPGKDFEAEAGQLELRRGTSGEKEGQLQRLREFQSSHAGESQAALQRLKKVCIEDGNIFAELMESVRSCSLGQITGALYEVGGKYRRNM
jgi:methylmalonyl-CoA mutase